MTGTRARTQAMAAVALFLLSLGACSRGHETVGPTTKPQAPPARVGDVLEAGSSEGASAPARGTSSPGTVRGGEGTSSGAGSGGAGQSAVSKSDEAELDSVEPGLAELERELSDESQGIDRTDEGDEIR